MTFILTILFSFFICFNIGLSQTGIISGKVYSLAGNIPLENSKIILKKNNRYYAKAKTDHVGNYWFGRLKTGSYSIWVLADDYCELEMTGINLEKDKSIHLDLGLMESALNSLRDKAKMVYQQPIEIDFEKESPSFASFKNEVNIINEVYLGNEIRIAPKNPPPSALEQNRATHFYNSAAALEKGATAIRPTGL